jgi:hypothetical protein
MISYIGHSQGTTQMFVALSAYPEFFKKHMQLFIAIAPVMYLSNMSAELFVLMSKSETIITLAEK